MCKKIKEKGLKLRTELRKMEPGQEISFEYNPEERSLSSIRATASIAGIDFNRKFRVSKQENNIVIVRTQ